MIPNLFQNKNGIFLKFRWHLAKLIKILNFGYGSIFLLNITKEKDEQIVNHKILETWENELKSVLENAVIFSCKSLSTTQKKHYFDK